MKLSAKPMSPDLRAAENAFQLFRCSVAWGWDSPPKRCIWPSGKCKVRLPWRSFCSRRSTVRADAGIAADVLGAAVGFDVVERFMGAYNKVQQQGTMAGEIND
jgi:hypothetical protein